MNPFKRLYNGAIRAQRWRYRAERRVIRKLFHPLTKSMKKLAGHQQPKSIGHRLEVSIWYRPLNQSLLSQIFTKSTSHWCIQVGDHYYELGLNEEHQPIRPESLSQNPFESSKRKKIRKSTYTNLSAEEVEKNAQDLFDQEFQRYSLGMEDCQQFCLGLLELICHSDKDFEDISTYIYSKSFAFKLAIASNPPAHR